MQQKPSSAPSKRIDNRRWEKVESNLSQLVVDGKRRDTFRFAQERGGPPQFSETFHATTRKDARDYAAVLRAKLSRGEVAIGSRTLTIEALKDSFLERERGELGRRAPNTIAAHERLLTTHVVPLLGPRTRVADIRVQHVRRMVEKLRATQRAGSDKKLSGSSVRRAVSAASAMFRHAVVDLGVINSNPCRQLERGELPSGKRQTEPRYLGVAQVETLLLKLSDEFRPVATACFYAGLRVSEALALTWDCIDFDGSAIRVPGTKSEASKATVPLLPALARELRAHRERQGRRGFDRIAPEALLFQTSSGKSPGRRNVLRAVQNAAARAGLVAEGQESVGCHDLRHSLAANAFALEMTSIEVARLLRHANPQVTMTVYAGLIEGDVASALGAKLAALGGSS